MDRWRMKALRWRDGLEVLWSTSDANEVLSSYDISAKLSSGLNKKKPGARTGLIVGEPVPQICTGR